MNFRCDAPSSVLQPDSHSLGAQRNGAASPQHVDQAAQVSAQKPDVAPDDFCTVFTNPKAGMQGVNVDAIKQKVYELSKDSPHYKEEQRKLDKVKARISRMKADLEQATQQQLQATEAKVDSEITRLEAQRDLSRVCMHVDMDSFFASVEERENPALATKNVAVGGIGMISTANYNARKHGVRAAMPGFIALKLCPDLVFVKPSYDKYVAAAEEARTIFQEVDPDFAARGLDEAGLDATAYCAQTGKTPAEVAADMRAKVFAKTQLTCSVGIAADPMIAKVCSDLNKPNGQFEVAATRDAIVTFVRDLCTRKIPGIGKVSEMMLQAFDVYLVGDIVTHRAALATVFTPASFDVFLLAALGLSSGHSASKAADCEHARKGMSHESTFTVISSKEELEAKAEHLARRLSEDLVEAGLAGKCVTLKLKTDMFQVRTRSVTLPSYVSSKASLYEAVSKLLLRELPVSLRLMGIRVSCFKPTQSASASQPLLTSLLTNPAPSAEPGAEDALDSGPPLSQAAVASSEPQATVASARPAEFSQRVADQAGPSRQADGAAAAAIDVTLSPIAASCLAQDAGVVGGGRRASPEVQGATVRCAECGEPVPAENLHEHEDGHVAQKLSSEINGPGFMASRSAPAERAPVRKRGADQAAGRAGQKRGMARKRSDGDAATSHSIMGFFREVSKG